MGKFTEGNTVGRNKGRFRAALEKAIADRAKSRSDEWAALQDVAGKLIDNALAGDNQAIKEIADRLDGKASQPVEMDGSLSVVIDDRNRPTE